MKIEVENKIIEFKIIEINLIKSDIENIFQDNKKKLRYTLEKAIADSKNRLHKIAKEHKIIYEKYLDFKLGDFLFQLKLENNQDYRKYLNKYGDNKYCIYKIEEFQTKRGIYCYILENKIVYIGRSKKTFKQRINEYGKITAYNCLIDGQATNCNINSKINELQNIQIGIHIMEENSDAEIMELEKLILKHGKLDLIWNIQKK